MVIFLHSYSAICYQIAHIPQSEFLNAVFWGSFVRVCVPLFLIVNGITILGKNYPIATWIFEKTILRLLVPVVFYGLIFMFNKHSIKIEEFLSPGNICYHFHFITIILTLYLIYPLIKAGFKRLLKVRWYILLYFG